MKRNISDLKSEKFDLVIIGGGISGAFLALDAILRGLSVALVEKSDFGAATSSASSKLLHGGIRYLQQGKFSKVRESAFERVYYQTLAPHLTNYIPFVIPTYKDMLRSKAFLKAGMLIYDLLCTGQNFHIRDPSKKVPKGHTISADEINEIFPALNPEGITGGALFYESHMHNSERMTLAVLDTAASHGAAIANYMRMESFCMDGKQITGIRARDLIADSEVEIRASVVVNAAGPWIPDLNSVIGHKCNTRIVTGFSKGAHIVTRSLTKGHAIALATRKKNQALINRGGRHVFIIPWRNHSLIGTTYGAYDGELDDVCATMNDVAELIEDVNPALDSDILKQSDVLYTFAGIYPLIEDKLNPQVYQGTGSYQIVDHQLEDGLSGLVSVFGAKYTTARILAEKSLDLIARKFSKSLRACQTRNLSLDSGDIHDLEAFRRSKKIQYAPLISNDAIDHLITNYGTTVDRLVNLVRDSSENNDYLSSRHHVLIAEVIYAVKNEMACCLDDVIFRRTGIGTLGNPGLDVLTRCAELMGDMLGWDEDMWSNEVHRALNKFQPC